MNKKPLEDFREWAIQNTSGHAAFVADESNIYCCGGGNMNATLSFIAYLIQNIASKGGFTVDEVYGDLKDFLDDNAKENAPASAGTNTSAKE